jgi:hypothetical protein
VSALLAIVSIALVIVAVQPTTSEVYIDFEPATITQPLYAKVLAFVDRDVQMRQLAARVVGDAVDAEEKAERILRWTHTNIRPTPPGMPIVDDHVLNIVIRGYGQIDQGADVFANLATYAGMPGGLVYSKRPDGRNHYAFGVIRIDGADRVFDVREGRALRDRDGRLASVAELRADPSMLRDLPPPAGANGVPYPVLVASLETGTIRRPSNQMPVSRLMDELAKFLRR